MSRYLSFNVLYFFCVYAILYVGYSIIANYILLDDTLYYSAYCEIVALDRIDYFIEQQKYYQKFSYFIIPLLLLFRPFFTSLCLQTGAFFTDVNLQFNQCFNIALKADVIFLLEVMIRIIYFSMVGANSLQEINTPLFSALQWFGQDNVPVYLSYPLGVLSVFELTYWVLLSVFISSYTKKKFVPSLFFVLTTYGVGILLWIIAIIYLTLLFT